MTSCWLVIASGSEWIKRVDRVYLGTKIINDNWCDGRYPARVMNEEEKSPDFPQLGQQDSISLLTRKLGASLWDGPAIPVVRFTTRRKA